ncbi:ParB-like partition protein [Burkholderia phage BcepNazgul]|uniref:Possible transcription regulator n=1 Tax=Burkholderia phage BcepNazgul TaxID=242861 RepID=Q6UYL1_9CAUD|nr:ParB-like partition protein [Burkholderia phage BcepNazgul]AAQ63330.1 possible transcription regulator [Burkholderia phage BcepNazgul]
MAKIQIPGELKLDAPEGSVRAALKEAGATDGERIRMVPPDSIHIVPGLNPRFWGSPKSKAHIEDIAKSMIARAASGLPAFMPERALVCFARKIDGVDRLVLKAGQHRLAAVAVANKKQPGTVAEVPVFVDENPMTDAQLALYYITENRSEKLGPYEMAVSVARAAEAGATKKEIMAELNISDRYLYDLGLLYNADPRVIELLAEGKVSGTTVIEEIKEYGQEKAAKRLLKGIETAAAAGKTKVTRRHLPAEDAPAKEKKTRADTSKTDGGEQRAADVPVFNATLSVLEVVNGFHEQFGESDDRHTKIMFEIIKQCGGDELVQYAADTGKYEATGLVRLGLVELPEEPAAAEEDPAIKAQAEKTKSTRSRKSKKTEEPVESPVGTAEGL